MEKDKTNKNRRDFLKRAGLLLGIGASATSLSSLVIACRDETVPLSPPPSEGDTYNIYIKDYPDLKVVGSILKCNSVLSSDSTKILPVIVKVLPDDKFIIVQHNCTHQGDQELPARVNNKNQIVCPRHFATYSMLETQPGKLVANPNNVNATDLKVYKYEYKKVEKIIVLNLD